MEICILSSSSFCAKLVRVLRDSSQRFMKRLAHDENAVKSIILRSVSKDIASLAISKVETARNAVLSFITHCFKARSTSRKGEIQNLLAFIFENIPQITSLFFRNLLILFSKTLRFLSTSALVFSSTN